MKLSTKGRYGLKAMFYLALNFEKNSPTPIKEIADDQKISEAYLEQIFSKLRRENIIKSIRGSHGGYLLARLPKNITVGDVIKALEGDLAPSDCAIEGENNICDNEKTCVTKTVWVKIRDSVNNVIDNITLQDMVDEYYNGRNII